MAIFLKELERHDLYKWLGVSELATKKIGIEYADGVLVAELLQQRFPEIADKQPYAHRSSIRMRVENWQRLNERVLAKLNLRQTGHQIQLMANGNALVIESLLYAIKCAEVSYRNANRLKAAEVQGLDVQLVTVHRRVGDGMVAATEPLLKYSVYLEKLREYQLKTANMNAATQQIQQLEESLEAKNEQITQISALLKCLAPHSHETRRMIESTKRLRRTKSATLKIQEIEETLKARQEQILEIADLLKCIAPHGDETRRMVESTQRLRRSKSAPSAK